MIGLIGLVMMKACIIALNVIPCTKHGAEQENYIKCLNFRQFRLIYEYGQDNRQINNEGDINYMLEEGVVDNGIVKWIKENGEEHTLTAWSFCTPKNMEK